MNPDKRIAQIDRIVESMRAQLKDEGYGEDDCHLIITCVSGVLAMFLAGRAPLHSDLFIKAIELIPGAIRLMRDEAS